jgi:hypothetical protein
MPGSDMQEEWNKKQHLYLERIHHLEEKLAVYEANSVDREHSNINSVMGSDDHHVHSEIDLHDSDISMQSDLS